MEEDAKETMQTLNDSMSKDTTLQLVNTLAEQFGGPLVQLLVNKLSTPAPVLPPAPAQPNGQVNGQNGQHAVVNGSNGLQSVQVNQRPYSFEGIN